MRTGTLLLVIFFLCAFGCRAQAQQLPNVEMDIAYGKDDAAQKLDLYLPANKGFATVVYTYGGGWHAGSGKSSKPIAEKLQNLGYGCALISHRLSPPFPFPTHAEDVAAAFAWVKANIAKRGGNAKRIILAGHSSGAHLSLLIAADSRYLMKYKLSAKDILAVIGLSSPVDLEPKPDGRGYGDTLMGGRGADAFNRDVGLLKDASPIQHLSKTLPPTLLVVGERDFPMLETDAKAFAKKAEGFGLKVETMLASGKDHMGVARGMTDDTDAVFLRVAEFLKALSNH